MTTVSATLGAASAPYTVEFNGKKVELGLITQAVKSGLERWLFEKRIQAIKEAREVLGDEATYKEQLDKALEEKMKGRFGWGSRDMMEAMASLPGISKTISLISKDKETGEPVEPDVVEYALQDPATAEEITVIFKTIFEESMPQKKTIVNPPKASRKR